MREVLYNWKYKEISERITDILREKKHDAYFVENKKDVVPLLDKIIDKKSLVSVGGSITLDECGVLDFLRNGEFDFNDRYSSKSPEESLEIQYKTFKSDYFFCSANALTMNGEIVQLDGSGTRVAPMIWGPKKVVMVVGMNKIVQNIEAANERLKYIAPMNAKRLNAKTPCTRIGECVDCKSPDRICVQRTIIETGVKTPGRYIIILVGENIGL